MDVLDDILDTLDLRGAFYFRTDFSGSWAVTVPDYAQAARFHLVVQGQLHVGFENGDAVTLGAGDLILIPRGRQHVLSDQACQSAPPLETVLSDVGYDGEGVLIVGEGVEHAKTKMVCGHFTFRKGADHAILRALPDYQIVSASMRAENPMLDEATRLLVRQTFSGQLGSKASVTRLSEIMFIELLRASIENNAAFETILNAFSDKHIGRAIELIHAKPDHPWTVETLASEVGMSRSRFADRFKTLLEIGPMSYLSDWRMQKAISLLEDTKQSVQHVAQLAGYKSPAAFTRAFSEKFGVSPTEYRLY